MIEKKIKTAPHSKESEMMVLGCMLTNINSLNVAADLLEPQDFFFLEHREIFLVLKEAYCKDQPADIHLVSEELKRRNRLEEIGGIPYLTTLAQYAATSAYVEEYAKLVKDKATLRKMITAAQDIEKTALEEPQDVHSALDEAQKKLFQISQITTGAIGVTIKELLSGVKATSEMPYLKDLENRQEEFQKKGPSAYLTGIPTHFIDLDRITNGFANSNLIILAARPAMGKTALALNIAENICFKNNLPVAIFSLEMSAEQLLHRLICSHTGVESEKIKTGALDGREYQKVVSSVNDMMQHTMIIDDQPALKITDLRARARRLKETYDIGFVVIDYLQLLSGSGNIRSQDNRQYEISEISRMMKNLAREINIPILCLSQLSRKVEERTGHRPMMSDLRESGCLSKDTLIQNAKTGSYHTILELTERKEPFYVFGFDEKLKMNKYRLLKAFSSGKKQLFELKTLSGKKIKATANHPFLKPEGWTRLDQLQINDKIGVLARELSWDTIISIKALEVEDVYDATIENVHNFVANDIIVHNSIEQDSDQVVFLLRREYYDPYDKPGQAELIIAKNRHGSIGNIILTFRKEIAQFQNFSQTPINNDEAFSSFNP